MKAIHLTMNAFGPYKYKQVVDFTQLGEESIFLVTGPTGAGKTTIFDAMCFALYGRASGTDRDQDTLKSHFAKDDETTYVNFVFMLRGKQYRIERMPKQWKKKERGEGLKEEPTRAQLYLIQDEEERLLASKIKEVNETIEDLLRLDYEQFRKMIMIPQGEFRKLISENSKEREDILQKIFHTHFYSQLTDHFKSLTKNLEEQMKQFEWKLEQETEKIQWDREEEVTENTPHKIVERLERTLTHQRSQKTTEEEQLKVLNKATEKAQENFHHSKNIEDLFVEQAKLREEKQLLNEEQKTMDQIDISIELAKRAAEVHPFKKQVDERQQEKQRLEKQLEAQKIQVEQSGKKFDSAKQLYEKEKSNQEHRERLKEDMKRKQEMLDRLGQVLTLDQSVRELENKQAGLKREQNEINHHKTSSLEEKERLNKYASMEREVTTTLYEAKEKNTEIFRQLDHINKLRNEWKKLQTLRTKYQNLRNETRTVHTQKTDAKKHYDHAIEELKQHRAYHLALDLSGDQPCPVCGSSEHPSLAEQPEGVKSNKEIDELKSQYEMAAHKYEQKYETMTTAKAEGESQKQIVETLCKEISHLKVEELTDELIEKYHRKSLDASNDQKRRTEEAEKQLKQAQEAADLLKKVEEKLQRWREQEEALIKRSHQLEQEKVQVETELHHLKNTYAFETFDSKRMEERASEAAKRYERVVNEWEKIQEDYQTFLEQYQTSITKKEETKRYFMDSKQVLQEKEEQFHLKLEQFQFQSVEHYTSALKPADEIQRMEDRIQSFEKRKAIADERLQELNTKLADQSRPDLDQVLEVWEMKKAEVEKQQQVVHHLQVVCSQNETVADTMKNLLAEQEDFSRQYYDLAELSNLARGDNPLKLSLERYVLASYLDEILIQANIRLDQMSDHRYQLTRSDAVAKRGAQSGLDLEVIDHHTGQKRSVRTLSGGEGFKASLSLALGMSDVVQSHAGGVQLETLFIDEGFGTLDEISLEQAIGCLRSLQDGNRMLGIISHVPQLKEEIPAKLQIHSGPEGSTVEFTFQ
ncbi:AAA family ATPase [Halobacillus sp. A1]|uniref:AAA family ATPase n=1 Tax=Halobacillus sp. A1 TaxID=2880262 RepID=UPI0020A64F98|nr:AAA family ATPase [Halobacillus sp. A1]MCP3030756.1 AAA family ATPase [Halobacillus sp. A1]